MSTKFKTVITTAGAAKLAAATVPAGKVNLSAMAVGDGNGKLPVPDAGQTKLVHEVWRHALNKVSVDNKNKTILWLNWLYRQKWAASGCVNLVCMTMPEH